MELTINSNSFAFSGFTNIHEKPKKKSGLIMKRLRVKRNNKLLRFNKWFEKEHDYCLPINKRSKLSEKNDNTKEENDIEEIHKSLDSNTALLNSSKTTNLEKINVNNELSSCSLYAIDVTTELLKDALLENKKTLSYVQSTPISKDSINSSDSCVSNTSNQPCCNKIDSSSRLNNGNMLHASDNENEKSCVSRESTPPRLFSPMDIDNDMIKLFPTLDFSTEHNLNEKLEYFECKEINTKKNISSKNTENTTHDKDVMCRSSYSNISKSSYSSQIENCIKSKCKVDTFHRKPCNNSQKLFSAISSNTNSQKSQLASEQYINIFDRYQGKSKEHFVEQVENPGPTLLRELLCGSKPKTIISPYTHRHLKPYIFRDPVTKPLWLQMLNELKEYFNQKKGLPKSKNVETIDYSYVRAKHIDSVNTLATQFFWPGIDFTESLLYPDFSVIALYKNLVIGFGFMAPDISTNENYITFLFTRPYWTNCGIAKFMIYHLIQTCMTRDITLHVSPNNPAMILYQKFGFKIEEFVQNFYENYIPAESNLSKHAFFLRLRSTLKSI